MAIMGGNKASLKASYPSLVNSITIICAYSLLFSAAKSEDIMVGDDDNRWTDGFNYVPWTKQHNFTVGDVLVFSYSEGKHNVYDVPKATYQSCNLTDGFNALYDSGSDRVELKEAKQYWFICTVDHHCSFGMKVAITVSQSNATFNGTIMANQTIRPSISSGIHLLIAAGLSILVIFIA